MKRVMLYGGCHAQVMRDYFVAAYEDVEVDLVVNFHLIQSGDPFPASRLESCDALVYSPIENKGAYNTAALRDHCREIGKEAICFPWLEWHGYCPGASKGQFKSRHQWFYPDLIDLAKGFDDFDSFRNHIIEHFPGDEIIDHVLRLSSKWLAAAEDRHGMTVRLSDFVESYHRASRLFLISDHPSRMTYEHILRQIVDQLSLPFNEEALVEEPQWQCRTPIFPRVAQRLGLEFEDQMWADDMLMPNRMSDLDTYLRLYFHADSVILAPIHDDARLESGTSFTRALPVSVDTRILAVPLDTTEHEYQFLAIMAGAPIALAPLTTISIDANQWRRTWDQ